jgi:glycolate oxidase FAD binding subunit
VDLDELVEAVRASNTLRIVGTNSKEYWSSTASGPILETAGLRGIVEHHVDDQVVIVRAGTPVAEFQRELAVHGQGLPLPWAAEGGAPGEDAILAGLPGTLGGCVSFNLPHLLDAKTGSWRDWVLGMTVVRPDGTVARAGSQAVKNVAGYDVQKLMIGARGTLGVIAEVILRTTPLPAIPTPNHRTGPVPATRVNWIQRTLPIDFERAVESAGDRLVAVDSDSATLWADADDLPRFEGDWVLRAGQTLEETIAKDDPLLPWMRRTREIFDPQFKLNPHETAGWREGAEA